MTKSPEVHIPWYWQITGLLFLAFMFEISEVYFLADVAVAGTALVLAKRLTTWGK